MKKLLLLAVASSVGIAAAAPAAPDAPAGLAVPVEYYKLANGLKVVLSKTYIVPERMAIVVVGDRKIIDEQVAPFAKANP